jgi:hypothetical protein
MGDTGIQQAALRESATQQAHQNDTVGAASVRFTWGHGGIGDFVQRKTSEGANHVKDHETN